MAEHSEQKGRHLPSWLCAWRPDHEGRRPQLVVIVLPFVGSVKEYIAAILAQGCPLTLPDDCPHPDCQASGSLIRWGTYERRAATEEVDYRIRIQRLRCKVCGRTHSLLPDFLHPHRHFVLALLYRIVALYLIEGWSWESLMRQTAGRPVRPARRSASGWALLPTARANFCWMLYSATCWPWHPTPKCLPQRPITSDVFKDTRKRRLLEKAYSFLAAGRGSLCPGQDPAASSPFLEQAISSLFCFTGCKASPFHRDCSGHRPCPAHLPRLSKPFAGIV